MSLKDELKNKATEVQTARGVERKKEVSRYLTDLCHQYAEQGVFSFTVNTGTKFNEDGELTDPDIMNFCSDNGLDCNLVEPAQYRISSGSHNREARRGLSCFYPSRLESQKSS